MEESRDVEDIPITTYAYNKSNIIYCIKNNIPIPYISNREGYIGNYTIYFPEISEMFPAIEICSDGYSYDMIENMSYPVCNCPSYYHNNSKRNKGHCKHIYNILSYIYFNIDNIDWSKRSPLLVERCKILGYPTFQYR